MISYLEGKITAQDDRSVVLNVGGVGYRIFVKGSGKENKEYQGGAGKVSFWVHQYQRQEGSELYGFGTRAELDLFEKLLSVSGVGPKSALAVLGQGGVEDVVGALAEGDISFFAKISGIGRKTAERIVMELRGRIEATSLKSPKKEEALEALLGLGYRREEARRALEQTPKKTMTVEAQVTEALRILGKR